MKEYTDLEKSQALLNLGVLGCEKFSYSLDQLLEALLISTNKNEKRSLWIDRGIWGYKVAYASFGTEKKGGNPDYYFIRRELIDALCVMIFFLCENGWKVKRGKLMKK